MMNEHTAKAFDVDLQDLSRLVAEMGGLAEKQIADSIDALAKRDARLAQRVAALDPSIDALQREIEERAILTIARRQPMAVWKGDEEIDAMCTSLFRELLTYMMEDPRNITFCTHLLFCAKNIERIGDHATNIAETVYYIAEGRALTDERPKGDSTSSTTVPFPVA